MRRVYAYAANESTLCFIVSSRSCTEKTQITLKSHTSSLRPCKKIQFNFWAHFLSSLLLLSGPGWLNQRTYTLKHSRKSLAARRWPDMGANYIIQERTRKRMLQRFFTKLNGSMNLLRSERPRIIFWKSLPIIGSKMWQRLGVSWKIIVFIV